MDAGRTTEFFLGVDARVMHYRFAESLREAGLSARGYIQPCSNGSWPAQDRNRMQPYQLVRRCGQNLVGQLVAVLGPWWKNKRFYVVIGAVTASRIAPLTGREMRGVVGVVQTVCRRSRGAAGCRMVESVAETRGEKCNLPHRSKQLVSRDAFMVMRQPEP